MPELCCEVADRCGGCPAIGLSREAQRALKVGRVAPTLAELGFDPSGVQWLAVPAPDGYRNRIRLRLDSGVPCFFNPHKSADCAVLEPALHGALAEFRSWARHHRELLEPLHHVEVRTPDLDGVAGVVLAASPNALASECAGAAAAITNALPTNFVAWLAGSGEPPMQRYPITSGVYTFVPLGSFRQVNTALNSAMVDKLIEWLVRLEIRCFADTYCGAGNLSLPLLANGWVGGGVESDPAAVAGLRRAAARQRLDASEFVAADAEAWLTSLESERLDVLIADPPRAGLRRAAGAVARLSPKQLVLISCASEGFGRDAKALAEAGYQLVEVCLADMFPHTEHVELMARFARS